MNLTGCIFIGNNTTGSGGAIYKSSGLGSNLTAVNCIFIGNTSGRDGGSITNRGDLVVTNCTFRGNSADDFGGGIYNGIDGTATVSNSIFWLNEDNGGTDESAQIHDNAGTALVNYSCIQDLDTFAGNNNIDQDPLFVDADGPDDTLGTEDDSLRLLDGSPCIDAGDNTAVPGGIENDLDGRVRFADDPCTDDGGNGAPPIVDMGAYEYRYRPRLYVDDTAPGPFHDGSSWRDAYIYLQDALTEAVTYGNIREICVVEGTYRPDQDSSNPGGTGDREATFKLINRTVIKGGYAGYGTWKSDFRDIDRHWSTLNGDLAGNDVGVTDPCGLFSEPTRAENSYHVVYADNQTDETALLDGFYIIGGNANNTDTDDDGGGMYIRGEPTVSNCRFYHNSADDFGGGMHINSHAKTPTVSRCNFNLNAAGYGGGMQNSNDSYSNVINCRFEENSATDGGGMYNFDSNPTVSDCYFASNNAVRYGGGMTNHQQSMPVVTSCTYANNSAIRGGGMYNYDNSIPTVTGSTFIGNSATDGGGMFNYNSTPDVTSCSFLDNSAVSGGGGINNYEYAHAVVTDCIFRGNSAHAGGALQVWDCYPSVSPVINCTFIMNTAEEGGAIEIGYTTMSIINCLIADNSATDGGGVKVSDSNFTATNCTWANNSATGGRALRNTDSDISLYNCILWDGGSEIAHSNSVFNTHDNDIQGGWPFGSNINQDPNFFDDNNPDPLLRDYHLHPGSPCIDSGETPWLPEDFYDLDNDVNIIEDLPWDIDTDVRVSGTNVDMGCDEAIYDRCSDINSMQLILLNPGGGPNDPNYEAMVVFRAMSDDTDVEVTEMSTDLHDYAGAFEALGKTVRVETNVGDGDFFMTVMIPFDANDLDDPNIVPPPVDVMYWDANTGEWQHAISANTSGTKDPDFQRWDVVYPPDAAPTLQELELRGIGANGVFWNIQTQQGFVWANVNHTSDFEGFGHSVADFEPDGDVDFVDFARFAAQWGKLDCGACYGADFTYDGAVTTADLRKFAVNWLAGK
jgi:hypothetical protein